MYLYFLGAAVKKYNLFKNITPKFAILGYFICCAITIAFKLLITYFIDLQIPVITGIAAYYGSDHLMSYTSVTTLLSSVFLLLFCTKIRINSKLHKPLKLISPMVFQVYIFHSHSIVWDLIIKNKYSHLADYSIFKMLFTECAVILGIFTLGLIVDFIRIQIFKLLRIDTLIKKASDFTGEKLKVLYDKL